MIFTVNYFQKWRSISRDVLHFISPCSSLSRNSAIAEKSPQIKLKLVIKFRMDHLDRLKLSRYLLQDVNHGHRRRLLGEKVRYNKRDCFLAPTRCVRYFVLRCQEDQTKGLLSKVSKKNFRICILVKTYLVYTYRTKFLL